MKKGIKIALISLAVLIWVAGAGLLYVTRTNAIDMVNNPIESRNPITESPSDYGIPYEDVSVITADGFHLAGWYVPSQNGAFIISQHGLRGGRNNMLYDAELLYRHGFGVLLSSFRAHDVNEGTLVTFGKYEIKDLEAWHKYLLTRTDIDQSRI